MKPNISYKKMTKPQQKSVLFLCRLYAPHVGGVENHVEQITKYLSDEYAVTIMTEQYEPHLPLSEKKDAALVLRIPLHYQSEKNKKLHIWWWMLQHFGEIWHADVIHMHDVFFWLLPFYPVIFWKKLFMTFHGYEPPGPPTPRQVFWHRVAAQLTRGNICIGQFHEKWYHVQPTAVSYGGVDVRVDEGFGDNAGNDKGVAPVSENKKNQQERFIFVGRIEPDTGIAEYIRAFKILYEKNKNSVFEIYGEGHLENVCKKFVEEHHLPVYFHGRVKGAGRFFTRGTVAFTSQYLSILQALAQGSSVVSFAGTPMKYDYLTMTPFVQWIAVTRHVEDIVIAAEKKKVSEEGQNWAQQQTWQKVAELYKTVWQK